MTDLGESLKRERKIRNISLKEISQKTKINLKLLKALENGEFHLIPGDFYFKIFIKNYLCALGADAEEFFKDHKTIIEGHCSSKNDTALKYIPKLKYLRFKKKNIFLTFCSFLFLIILIVIFFYINKTSLSNVWDFAFGKFDLPDTSMGMAGIGCQFSLDRSPVHVTIDFLENCWARVKRGGGEVVERTYKKGERVDVRGYEFSLYIENPGSVKFLLNGREVSYLKNLSQPERIEINPQNLDLILNKQ